MAPRILLVPLLVVHLVLIATHLPVPRQEQTAAAAQPSQAAAQPMPSAAPAAPEQRLAAAPAADDAAQALARAEALRAAGDPEAALAHVLPHLEHPDPPVAAEAGYRAALLRLELGYPKEAAGALDNLLARFSREPVADRATFLLALAHRQADNCPATIDVLSRYTARGGRLAPQANLQLAACYQQLGDTGAALARADQALQQSDVRMLRIEALERQAAIVEQGGDPAGALQRWEQLVELARAPSYKAEARLAAARLNRALGRTAQAITHYVAAVNEAPTVAGAATALDQLGALDAQGGVSYYQAGLVRFWSRDYDRALANFEGALRTPCESADAASAAYYHAAARLRKGAEAQAVAELLALPGSHPTSRHAPEALLRAGKILESNGSYREAAATYRRLAQDYPAAREAREGLFRLGLAHQLRSDRNEAAAAWAELEASDAPADLKSLGLLWQGKLEAAAGRHDAARARWQAAVDLAPGWYGGIRSRGLLAGNVDLRVESVPLDSNRIEPSQDELATLSAWTAERGAPLDALAAELSADPALARLDDLLALGLKLEASWEVDHLGARAAGDPARSAALALALHHRGLYNAAERQAQTALDTAKVGSRQAPVALQKLLYQLPYAEQFVTHGQRYGADPLAFAALVRQESHFLPDARSSADARGLTQVMPATGREIANALGRPAFKVEDLYRPAVSIEFGAFYFGQRLKRFGGALFPALAAYNAGDGAVDRWLRDYGAADMDLFAERIPYAETNAYLKVIFENYGMYRMLYGTN